MSVKLGVLVGVLIACAALPLAQTPAAPGAAPAPSAQAAGRGPATAARGNNVDPRTMPLWENGAPGAMGTEDVDIPTLTYYPAYSRPSGTAVIVAPGGGYSNLAMNHEGRQVANWYNSLGIAAFVLKYRLGPKYHHPIELGDAQRAIRLVRARAAEFGVLPDRVGIMGFSAGGHLASTAGTHYDAGNASATDPIDRVSSRPDFLVLAYAVITSKAPYAHQGSFRSLLGDNPDPKLLDDLSNETKVTPDTPPTFLFHTNADTTVPAENSVFFYLALRKAGVPAELHIFQPGSHGLGLAMGDQVLEAWPPLLSTWLRSRGLLTNPTAPAGPGGTVAAPVGAAGAAGGTGAGAAGGRGR